LLRTEDKEAKVRSLFSEKLGLVLAAIHISIFVVFIVYLLSVMSRDGQAQLLWMIWIPIDFPISLLVPVTLSLVSDKMLATSKWLTIALSYLPYFVHGVLGTVWWYLLPKIFRSIKNRIGKMKSTA
jgi:hypothetical protein